ncbi:MAG: acyl-phosphate glycerol 3-phosphate acyltransferase [Rickettsiales bacterium]|nr:acyl-phosphate glycerol 3-phosphate acyltransferase [Rickettsiales bacterium]OUV83309.1 MAG: acyl-phosphate glycerol 3-phosphate acyltransferase [Rickettsiales bacterium TMED131]
MLEILISNKINYIFFFCSYILGSIPFGYIFYKINKNDDIRKYGSGNIGATNVNRLLGKKFATLTLFLDFSKTFIPCFFIQKYFGTELGAVCGIITIIGHMFPFWLRFRGGKGVASYIGFILVISWPLCCLFIFIWALTVKVLKYSALGAIIAIISQLLAFNFILYVQFNLSKLLWIPGEPIEFHFALFISSLILLKHRKNIISIIKL